jgi:hypothetical protein
LTLDVIPRLEAHHLFYPIAISNQPAYTWAWPNLLDRTVYTLFDQGSLVLSLPFTLTLAGRSYTDFRVYDDGFVVLGGSATPAALPTHCLANQVWPSLTLYGWWSDLRPVPGFSRLSTFTSTLGSFVIEYENFQAAGSGDSADSLSLQIVLTENGQVDFNYRTVPRLAPPAVTVGVAAADGRFYNQVACRAANLQVGNLPTSRQTLTFLPEELY